MTSTPYLIASKKFFKLSENCNTIEKIRGCDYADEQRSWAVSGGGKDAIGYGKNLSFDAGSHVRFRDRGESIL